MKRSHQTAAFLFASTVAAGSIMIGCRNKQPPTPPSAGVIATQKPVDMATRSASDAAGSAPAVVPDMAAASSPTAAAEVAADQDIVVFAVTNYMPVKNTEQPLSAVGVPAICYSAKQRRVLIGKPCVRLVPPLGAKLRLGDTRTANLGRRSKLTCHDGDNGTDSDAISFALSGPPRTRGSLESTYTSHFDFNPFAIWPEEAAARVRLVDRGPAAGQDERKELLTALGKEYRKQQDKPLPANALQELSIDRRLEADLDGDGLSDVLYTLMINGDDYLFARNGRSPRKLTPVEVVLANDDYSHPPEPIAVMDLDQDGQPELLLKRYAYSGNDLFIGRLTNNRLKLTSATDCKPIWTE